MIQSFAITLYGSCDACTRAKVLLENLQTVHQVTENTGILQIQADSLTENELVTLLAQSGISGFKLSRATR